MIRYESYSQSIDVTDISQYNILHMLYTITLPLYDTS